jgi:septal ring factor EnvC (AmiA/AmiB activator)
LWWCANLVQGCSSATRVARSCQPSVLVCDGLNAPKSPMFQPRGQNMQTPDHLQQRLQALSQKLANAEKVLTDRQNWSDHHQRTLEQMKARHDFLEAEINDEVAELEAQGHHVSDLEHSLRQWLASVGLDLT